MFRGGEFMKLVLIFGPQAVGKMTVGQELEKITGLKLFHNHMTIELVSPFFSYGSETGKRLVSLFRREIFEEVSKSDLYGIIFTYVWAFDLKEDWEYINHICSLFENRGADIYFVELEAEVTVRLERNKSPHRLMCKPTKRNLEFSERDLKKSMEKYRLNSNLGEIQKENYIRINNTDLSPEEVAQRIKERFQL
jgi:hypothetical protein